MLSNLPSPPYRGGGNALAGGTPHQQTYRIYLPRVFFTGAENTCTRGLNRLQLRSLILAVLLNRRCRHRLRLGKFAVGFYAGDPGKEQGLNEGLRHGKPAGSMQDYSGQGRDAGKLTPGEDRDCFWLFEAACARSAGFLPLSGCRGGVEQSIFLRRREAY